MGGAGHRVQQRHAVLFEPAQPVDPALAVDARDAVVRVLVQLPPRQRAVLVLRYFEQLSEAETAEALGCSVGTVKSATARGLARLREMTAAADDSKTAAARGAIMNSDIEELAREGMRQFTADLRVSPDLVGRTFDGHRRRQRQRHVMRAGLALGAAGTVTAVTAITVAHGPVPQARPITAAALRTHLLAALDTASGNPLFAQRRPTAGSRTVPGLSPGWAEVYVRVGPAVGSDGKIYKDGAPSSRCPREPLQELRRQSRPRRAELVGTAMWVNHFKHTWSQCRSKFVLGFTLDPAVIHSELANGQSTASETPCCTERRPSS